MNKELHFLFRILDLITLQKHNNYNNDLELFVEVKKPDLDFYYCYQNYVFGIEFLVAESMVNEYLTEFLGKSKELNW